MHPAEETGVSSHLCVFYETPASVNDKFQLWATDLHTSPAADQREAHRGEGR